VSSAGTGIGSEQHQEIETRTELDSHADTHVVGRNAMVVHRHGRFVNVFGYKGESDEDPSRLEVVDAAVAHETLDGETIILMLNQALEQPTLEHNLLCLMQMRMNDVQVEEKPKFQCKNPTERDHAITLMDEGEPLIIPLSLAGITSYFPTRKPTLEELQSADNIRRFDLSYDTPEWNPHDESYQRMEASMTDHNGSIVEATKRDRRLMSCNFTKEQAKSFADRTSKCSAVLTDISNTLCDDSFLQALKDNVQVSSVTSTKRKSGITPEQLARNWRIGLETAKRTLEVTTQRGIRTVANPSLSRRFRTNDRQLRYRRIAGTVFTDTMMSSVTSHHRKNKCAQIFGMRNGWTRAFPMQSKSDAHEGLSLLFARDGVPNIMIMDNAKEQTMAEFRKKAREADCHVRQTEPHSPWSNYAESAIRELKKGVARTMIATKAPKKLWDHCLEFEAYIRSNIAHPLYSLNGEVPETVVSGQTADISEFAEHAWYDWVRYRDTAISFPEDKMLLGRYLGPSTDIGPAMSAKILKPNGQVVHRSTLRALTPDEWDSPDEIKARSEFDEAVKLKLGEAKSEDPLDDLDVETPSYETYQDDQEEPHQMPDRDDVSEDYWDKYLNAEVLLPIGDRQQTGVVKERKRDASGALKGKAHSNPILDTRSYVVEFPDGQEAEYSANVIAKSMHSQCDLDGNQFLLLDSITDHKKTAAAVPMSEKHFYHKGRKTLRKTTVGWKLCVTWKDGSTSWERLADLKESYPVMVAEYAVAHEIHEEPAFAWWVPYTLKKRDRIIAAVNKRYHKRTHKFGIRVPKTVEEARIIDEANGNTLWQDAIEKEMKNVRVAFKFIDGTAVPPGYQDIKCHMVFDIKMEDFRRKARFVAGGHTTETPASLTYSSVVSRESVRIALTLAALNDLEVKASDIQNAYLTAPVVEKITTICGEEFGKDKGRRAIVVRALYGLKGSGSAFRLHLADCMRHLGYFSCMADPDVWMKPKTRPSDGHKYYSYVLLYVDDCLAIDHDAEGCLRKIDHFFKMKPGSIGDPDFYLGAKMRKVTLPNQVEAWALSPSKYVQDAISNVSAFIEKEFDGMKLPLKASAPFKRDYRPEVDSSPELNAEHASFYHSQIGILRWMVELGRIDIITEVSLLSSHLALPREGHLEALLHVFAYLRSKHNSTIVFDPSYPSIDYDNFYECDWRDFYGDVQEPVPPNAPEPRGKEVDTRLYVDSDFAGDSLNRRSRTGYIVFLNMAPVMYFSKKQGSLETSVFGAEFVAMKTGRDAIRGLRYKLRMMGVPIAGPTFVYGDNMSVIHNTQRPESTLKKKSNAICYHAIRESVAMGELLTCHVPTAMNAADICTKVIPAGQKRDQLIGLTLHDLVDEMK